MTRKRAAAAKPWAHAKTARHAVKQRGSRLRRHGLVARRPWRRDEPAALRERAVTSWCGFERRSAQTGAN